MAETWDQLEDWEEWTPESGTSFKVHAIAGSLAGAAEHCVMFPVDTVRTHLQAEGVGRQVVRELVAREGPLRLWRGVSTMLTATVPAHAIYFSVYEESKHRLGADSGEHTPLAAAACGALATLGHDVILTPMDVIKQRLQLGLHRGMEDCARHVVRSEGTWALFRSLPTTLAMNVPFAGIMVAANESFKKVLNPSNEYHLPSFFVSGGLAGAVAAALTTPLDVIKTRLQTQSVMLELAQLQAAAAAAARGGASGADSGAAERAAQAKGFPARQPVRHTPILLGGGSVASSLRWVAQPAFGLAAPFYSRACRHKNLQPPAVAATPNAAKGSSTLPAGAPRPHSTGTGTGASGVRYRGFFDTAQRIYDMEGLAGFSRGVKPRVMVFAPSVAISWTTYETAKTLLAQYL
jgi:solute carrier family 25 iron transporter 28/37